MSIFDFKVFKKETARLNNFRQNAVEVEKAKFSADFKPIERVAVNQLFS
jgi:hypothetical protein